MTFGSADDEPSSDRLLMFSIIGIVLVIGLAFSYSMMNRKEPLPSVQPATPVVERQVQPASVQPPVTNPEEAPAQSYTAPPPVQPQYIPIPAPQSQPSPYMRGTGNRKLDGMRHMSDES
jgi:hypothetical protein